MQLRQAGTRGIGARKKDSGRRTPRQSGGRGQDGAGTSGRGEQWTGKDPQTILKCYQRPDEATKREALIRFRVM